MKSIGHIWWYDSDMIINKRLHPTATELFIWDRKLNIPVLFISYSNSAIPKVVKLNTKHFFIMKIPHRQELQQIVVNRASGVDFKDFMKVYRKHTVIIILGHWYYSSIRQYFTFSNEISMESNHD